MELVVHRAGDVRDRMREQVVTRPRSSVEAAERRGEGFESLVSERVGITVPERDGHVVGSPGPEHCAIQHMGWGISGVLLREPAAAEAAADAARGDRNPHRRQRRQRRVRVALLVGLTMDPDEQARSLALRHARHPRRIDPVGVPEAVLVGPAAGVRPGGVLLLEQAVGGPAGGREPLLAVAGQVVLPAAQGPLGDHDPWLRRHPGPPDRGEVWRVGLRPQVDVVTGGIVRVDPRAGRGDEVPGGRRKRSAAPAASAPRAPAGSRRQRKPSCCGS